MLQAPAHDDVQRMLVVFLGDLLDDGVLAGGIRTPDYRLGARPGRAQRAVRADVDALAVAVLDEVIVAPQRVHLHLKDIIARISVQIRHTCTFEKVRELEHKMDERPRHGMTSSLHPLMSGRIAWTTLGFEGATVCMYLVDSWADAAEGQHFLCLLDGEVANTNVPHQALQVHESRTSYYTLLRLVRACCYTQMQTTETVQTTRCQRFSTHPSTPMAS